MAGETVVVVDDADGIRTIVELMLQNAGYTVYSFGNAEDALVVSKSVRIDLFLIDVTLLGISGTDLLTGLNVKENPYEVIMISGKCGIEFINEATNLGAYACLQKPFRFNDLIAIVKKALASGAAKKYRTIDIM